jgi:hypothetical protein
MAFASLGPLCNQTIEISKIMSWTSKFLEPSGIIPARRHLRKDAVAVEQNIDSETKKFSTNFLKLCC